MRRMATIVIIVTIVFMLAAPAFANETSSSAPMRIAFLVVNEDGNLFIEKAHAAAQEPLKRLLNAENISYSELKKIIKEAKDLKCREEAIKIAQTHQLDAILLNVVHKYRKDNGTYIEPYTGYYINSITNETKQFDYVVRYTKADYDDGKRKGLSEIQTFQRLVITEIVKNLVNN